MARWSNWVDLGMVVVVTVLALGVTVVPVARWVLVVVAIPFLLFVPGYALLVALFPRQIPGRDGTPGRFAGLERFVLAVTISIAVAVVVGVNLGYTVFPIELRTVVGALAGVSLLGALVAAIRRVRSPESEAKRLTFGTRLRQRSDESLSRVRRANGGSLAGGSTIATGAVVVAVLVAVASVTLVAATPQRGETYTEFGLLTENEDGELVATGYPSELSAGDTTSLTFSVENKEMQTVEYVVVVQLVETAPDGTVIAQSRLDTYRNEVPAGGEWQQQHEVSPELTGQGLRLTYLLYRGDPPEQPAVENAYRETHIWVDVTPG